VGKQQGDIAPEVDPELAAVIFDAIMNNVGRYIAERVSRQGGAALQDGRIFLEQPDVKELFAQTVSILEHGLGRRSHESTLARSGDRPER
jgi:hypothetical protein